MNELVKVNGVNESFCGISIVLSLRINNLEKISLPDSVRLKVFFKQVAKSKSVEMSKVRKEATMLCLYMDRFHRLNKPYHLIEYKELINDVPKSFYEIKDDVIPYANGKYLHAYNVVSFKPSIIAYLDGKGIYPHFKEMFIELNKFKEDVDFDKFIDDWAKRLLKESS